MLCSGIWFAVSVKSVPFRRCGIETTVFHSLRVFILKIMGWSFFSRLSFATTTDQLPECAEKGGPILPWNEQSD